MAIALLISVVSCRDSAPAREIADADRIPKGELYRTAPDSAILSAARALMLADSNVALVTVDSMGQPRVRTVKAFVAPVDSADPAAGVTVWIMTRLTTRKIGQIENHPQVTLYFNDDNRVEYATIMGTAVIHRDPGNPQARRFYENAYKKFFWPRFPKDFVMIEVRPLWLEYLGPTIEANRGTWRPQAVIFRSAVKQH
jgi:general stress protein 26